jgi:DNA-binding transcriptional LysR family regulator
VIARALGECRSVLCASPGYLARAGQPETLDDLAQHNCLHYSRFSGQSWTFRDPEKGTVAVAVNGNFSAGISSLLCDMAMADVGLALVPEIEARAGLRVGNWSAYCRNWSRSRWAFMGYINPAIISMRRSACFSMRLSSISPLKPGSVPPSTAYVLCPAPGR